MKFRRTVLGKICGKRVGSFGSSSLELLSAVEKTSKGILIICDQNDNVKCGLEYVQTAEAYGMLCCGCNFKMAKY